MPPTTPHSNSENITSTTTPPSDSGITDASAALNTKLTYKSIMELVVKVEQSTKDLRWEKEQLDAQNDHLEEANKHLAAKNKILAKQVAMALKKNDSLHRENYELGVELEKAVSWRKGVMRGFWELENGVVRATTGINANAIADAVANTNIAGATAAKTSTMVDATTSTTEDAAAAAKDLKSRLPTPPHADPKITLIPLDGIWEWPGSESSESHSSSESSESVASASYMEAQPATIKTAGSKNPFPDQYMFPTMGRACEYRNDPFWKGRSWGKKRPL
jgi:hypothetical protein